MATVKIHTGRSPYGLPMFFSNGKNGTLRRVVVYRGLNCITKKNETEVPRADKMFDRLGQTRYFSKIVLRTGFCQVRIHPADMKKTAFTTKRGQFKYTVATVRLRNDPATFQTLMSTVFEMSLVNSRSTLWAACRYSAKPRRITGNILN